MSKNTPTDADGAGGVEGDALEELEGAGVDPSRYQGPERYVRTAEDFLDVELTAVQRRILRAVGEHQRVHIQSGNGVGKSYTAAILNLAFLIRHPGSTNLATSGSYSVLTDVLFKPMVALYERTELPGRCLQSPPRIEIDGGDGGDPWYFKAVAPRYAAGLEGRHSGQMFVTIEECDKPDITRQHIDSAGSSITSEDDRMLVISNPPEDEHNVAYELSEDPRWHTIEFSSFESRNVKVDAGETDADRIPGLVDLNTIREDWEAWNQEDWPGLESARVAHLNRDDLDTRWYRRRAGVVPPQGSAAHRPFSVGDVSAAWSRSADDAAVATSDAPSAVGIDVARSGDRTVLAGVHGDVARVHYSERGADHTAQEAALRRVLDQWEDEDVTIAVDAVGEGSGLGDRLQQAYGAVHRYKAGASATQSTEYKDCWAEGLAALGNWLADGGTVDDQRLREELLAAARTVTFEERHISSRGQNGATVLEASKKRDVKEQLGRSPDHLDAALMAAWAAAGHTARSRAVVRRGTPSELLEERAERGERVSGGPRGRRRIVRRRSGGSAGAPRRRDAEAPDPDADDQEGDGT